MTVQMANVAKEVISYDPVDLAFALLVTRHLKEEDPEERIARLEDLLDNNPYSNTVFIPEVRKLLEKERDELRESEEEENRDRRDRRDRD